MLSDDTREKLENIVRGAILEGKADTCTAARNLLCASFRTSTTVKKDFEGQSRIKAEQAKFLKHHSSLRNWWVNDQPDENNFLARGGEAKVYFAPDRRLYFQLLQWTWKMSKGCWRSTDSPIPKGTIISTGSWVSSSKTCMTKISS